MKYLYILLICLILFYLISRYFEKYYSQENFDPSLVPVSSIITLAKVAQKIVDGNGTLTNPANLNIGTTSAKGNLLVTGNSTTNGNTHTNGNEIVDGTLGVTGATTLNTLGVTGASTLSTLGVTGATTLSTLGVTGATTLTGGVTGGLNITGDTKLNGNLIATGTASNNITVKANGPNLATLSINTPGTGYTFYAADPSYTGGGGLSANHLQLFAYGAPVSGAINQMIDMYPAYTGHPNNTIILNADTFINNSLSVSGNIKGASLCIGGTCLNETHLKMLTGAQPIGLLYNTSNSASRDSSGNKTYVGADGAGNPPDGNVYMVGTDDASRYSSFYIKSN